MIIYNTQPYMDIYSRHIPMKPVRPTLSRSLFMKPIAFDIQSIWALTMTQIPAKWFLDLNSTVLLGADNMI